MPCLIEQEDPDNIRQLAPPPLRKFTGKPLLDNVSLATVNRAVRKPGTAQPFLHPAHLFFGFFLPISPALLLYVAAHELPQNFLAFSFAW